MLCKFIVEEFLSGRVCDGHQYVRSADDILHRHPTDETKADETKTETEAPVESTTEAAAAPAVTESKAEPETVKKVEEPKETIQAPETSAPVTEAKKDESAVQDAVDKVQASKAGQVSSLDDGETQANSKSYHQVR
jgi:hypothetical protein